MYNIIIIILDVDISGRMWLLYSKQNNWILVLELIILYNICMNALLYKGLVVYWCYKFNVLKSVKMFRSQTN